MARPRAWVLTESAGGMLSQPLGLAEALGLDVEIRLVPVRPPWDWLPGRLWPWPLLSPRNADAIAGQPPDLLLSCGNVAAPIAAALRRRFGCPVVHLQNPKLPLDRFDLVVGQAHDGLEGPNVLNTRLALHRVTDARLQQGRAVWSKRFAALPSPRIGVLVGGPNGRLRLGAAEAEGLIDALVRAAPEAGLMVTPSRRTPPEARAALRSRMPRHSFLWDLDGENPILGLLGLADALVVTEDSVSMVSEALATSAPVYLAPLPGRRSRRIDGFLHSLVEDGLVQRMGQRIAFRPRAPHNETPAVAREVCRRLNVSWLRNAVPADSSLLR